MDKGVTHWPWNTKDLVPIPGICRDIVARMTTYNESPLSLGPVPGCRLKKYMDIDKWQTLIFCVSPVSHWSYGYTCAVGIDQMAFWFCSKEDIMMCQKKPIKIHKRREMYET